MSDATILADILFSLYVGYIVSCFLPKAGMSLTFWAAVIGTMLGYLVSPNSPFVCPYLSLSAVILGVCASAGLAAGYTAILFFFFNEDKQ